MTSLISDFRSSLSTLMTDTRITAATIAVIRLESSPRIMTSKAINKRYGFALLIPRIPFSSGALNQWNRSPATNTAIVMLIGWSNASLMSGQSITWLTKTDRTPIINKNTSRLRSTNFVKGSKRTNNKMIVKTQ